MVIHTYYLDLPQGEDEWRTTYFILGYTKIAEIKLCDENTNKTAI